MYLCDLLTPLPPPSCHFLDYCSLNSSTPYFDKEPKEGSPLVFQNCHNFKIDQFVFFDLIWGGLDVALIGMGVLPIV